PRPAQKSRPGADPCHRLAGREEPADELDGTGIRPKGIRAHDPTGQDQTVIVRGTDVGGGAVDREGVAPVQTVEGLNAARFRRDQIDPRPSALKRRARLYNLAPLHPVSGEDG